MESQLAIVIPAYKHQYLKETLESIKSQTCQNFNLYIGNDDSPFPVKEVVEEYRGKINFIYEEFQQNLGSKSLVKHWDRCIEMTRGEEWIWLFSDDDIMGENCVKSFYEFISKGENTHLIRFNKVLIDQQSQQIEIYQNKEENTNFLMFLEEALILRKSITLPEFLFRRTLYQKYKFVEFPLGWCTDKATWLLYCSEAKGIRNLDENIFYRNSGENISTLNSYIILKKKHKAKRQFQKWLFHFLKDHIHFLGEKSYKRLLASFLDSEVYNLIVTQRKNIKLKDRLSFAISLIIYVHNKSTFKNVMKLVLFKVKN